MEDAREKSRGKEEADEEDGGKMEEQVRMRMRKRKVGGEDFRRKQPRLLEIFV